MAFNSKKQEHVKRIRANSDQIKDVLASLGNLNIWADHLDYFQQRIKELGEEKKSISDAPNYFAWLSLASEYIAWYIRGHCFFDSELDCASAFDDSYKTLIERFSGLTGGKTTESVLGNVIFFIKVRHIIVHKGFPTPHNVPSCNSRVISKGVTFDERAVWAVRNVIMEPKNFPLIYRKFSSLVRWLQSNQNNLQIGY